MLTKWYKEILKYLPVSNSDMKYGPQIKCTDGVNRYLYSKTNNSCLPWLSTSIYTYNATGNGFRVGSGTTAPTENDYALESVITSGITGSGSTSVIHRNSDGNIEIVFALSIKNSSSSDVTIGEVGYYGVQICGTQEGSSSNNQYMVMYHRAVLNSPVTIHPGDTAVINFRVIANESIAN